MPGPPSMRVLSTMVPTTKVMASVSSANSSPRTDLTRNTTAPSAMPSRAASSAAAGRVQRNGQFRLAASPAEVYMPMPKNAPCPKEKYPEYPERMFQDKARIIQWQRSEEHTSELQSLMRISYAVFCLKKKHTTNNQNG